MKVRVLLLSMLVLGFGSPTAFSQESANPLVVLKFSWERERLTMNPSMAPLASAEELSNTSRRERQLAAARNSDRSTATRLETETERHQVATAKAQQTVLPRDGYRYKVSLRNDTAKTVKSIDWDYLFVDPVTEEIAMRHQFASDETIKPGKTKEISVLYLNTPVKTVNVRMLVKKDPLPFTEQVIVARIQYSDGTVWQR